MLALDNGYDFIIVLGGRNNPLLNQNRKEFRDLLSPFTENESVNFLKLLEFQKFPTFQLRI